VNGYAKKLGAKIGTGSGILCNPYVRKKNWYVRENQNECRLAMVREVLVWNNRN
jgi:hypothetical protein